MIDPRTDLLDVVEGEFREITYREILEEEMIKTKAYLASPEYHRRLVDELAICIEESMLDELTDMDYIDGFVFLGTNLLELRLKGRDARSYKVREQACREVWFKYNH